MNNIQSNIPKILVSNDTTTNWNCKHIQQFFSINYSYKHFSNFLKNRSDDSFFYVPLTDMKLSISYPLLIQTNQLDLIVYLLRH